MLRVQRASSVAREDAAAERIVQEEEVNRASFLSRSSGRCRKYRRYRAGGGGGISSFLSRSCRRCCTYRRFRDFVYFEDIVYFVCFEDIVYFVDIVHRYRGYRLS